MSRATLHKIVIVNFLPSNRGELKEAVKEWLRSEVADFYGIGI